MLSIIIPAFNEERYLPRLLASIARQDGLEMEVVVADAQSTDRTSDISRAAGASVCLGGLPGAGRNRGAVTARGDQLLFLDADVVLSDQYFLKTAVDEFNARGLDIATCEIDPLSDLRVDRFMYWVYNRYARATARFAPHAPGFFILVKRSLHEAIGGFDENIRYAEDEDYARRAATAGRFGILDGVKIPVSVRRFERDGRFNIAAKNVLAELHLRTVGPIRSDIMKYRFGYDHQEEHRR